MKFLATFKNQFRSIKTVRLTLFFTLLALSLIPLLYTIFRGSQHFASDHLYNLHHNIVWGMFLFEVIAETLIFPVYYLLGTSIRDEKTTMNKIKTGTLLYAGLFFIASLVIILFVEPLVSLSVHDVTEVSKIAQYIRLEVIGFSLLTIAKYYLIILELKQKKRLVLGYLFVQMAIMILSDFIFVAPYSLLKWDLMGIGLTNILVGISLCIYGYCVLSKTFHFKKYPSNKWNFHWFHLYYHVGEHALIDAVLVNVSKILFLYVVAKGTGFLNLDSFLFVYIMVPIIALGDTLKCDLATSTISHHNAEIIKNNVKGYSVINVILILLLLLTSFAWLPLLKELTHLHILGEAEIEESVYTLLPIMGILFVIRSYQNIYDSAFYGLGEIGYMTKQAIATTLVVYVPSILLLTLGLVEFTPTLIVVVLACSILLDAILTFVYYHKMLSVYENEKGDFKTHHM